MRSTEARGYRAAGLRKGCQPAVRQLHAIGVPDPDRDPEATFDKARVLPGQIPMRMGTSPDLTSHEPLPGDTLTAIQRDGPGVLKYGVSYRIPGRSGVDSGARSVVGGVKSARMSDFPEVSG